MLTQHDLDRIGKQIADAYMSDDKPLTESLVKVSSDQGLNRQQINRVAEAANVEAYLGLMKKASDKYIDFDLADPNAAHEKVAEYSVKTEGNYSDYDAEPLKNDSSVFDMYRDLAGGDDSFSKTASVSKTASEAQNEALELKGTLNYLDDHMRESLITIEQDFDKLAFCVKQEILNETPFSNLSHIVEYAAPGCGLKIAEDLKAKFEPILTHIDFEAEPTYKGVPNPNSTIFTVSKGIDKEAERACKIYDAITHYDKKHADLAEEYELPKYARVGFVRSIGRGLINFFRKNKFLSGALVGGSLAYGSGKEKGRREQGSILKNYYEDNRPNPNQPIFRRQM